LAYETCSLLIATHNLEELLDNCTSSESEESRDLENGIDKPPRDDNLEVERDSNAGKADVEVGVLDGDDGGGNSRFNKGFNFNMGSPNQDIWMAAGPDIHLAFDLADTGVDDRGDDGKEPWINPEDDEDFIGLMWDQADSDSDSEALWQRADELEKWEECKWFRIQYGQYLVIF